MPRGYLKAWGLERRTRCAELQMQRLREELGAWLATLPVCSGEEGPAIHDVRITNATPVAKQALGMSSRIFKLADCFGCKVSIVDDASWQYVAPRLGEPSSPCADLGTGAGSGGSSTSGWFCLFADGLADAADSNSSRGSQVLPIECGAKDVRPALSPHLDGRPLVGLLPVAAATWLMTRPSSAVTNWMRQATRERNSERRAACEERPKIALHIRAEGGRCGSDAQATCLSPRRALIILHRIREQYGSCVVLLATDSEDAVEELWQLPGSSDFHWKWLHWERGQLKSSDSLCPTCVDQAVENRGGLDWHVGFSMAGDIALLSEGDVFVGGFDSMVALTFYLAMVGRTGMLPPYVTPKPSKHVADWALSGQFGCSAATRFQASAGRRSSEL